MAEQNCPGCQETGNVNHDDEDFEDRLTMFVEKVAQEMVNERWAARFPRHAALWLAKEPGGRSPPWASQDDQEEIMSEFKKLPVDVLRAMLKVIP